MMSILLTTTPKPKQGSPDARRIVAMLARDYRRRLADYQIGYTSYTYENGLLVSSKLAYTQAKQLLGK